MEESVDLKYAAKVAEHLGTHHTSVKFTPEEGLTAIPQVIFALESYDITTVRASVPMYLLCKWISENTDDIVIFSGEGADELFCGYLYWHNSPGVEESAKESRNLVTNLHNYDVLRADRAVSCHGLELRVPFLDKEVTDFAFTVPAKYKVPTKGWEKYLLRKAFEDILPESVAWRRKDGLSDGCSGLTKSWADHIKEFVDTKLGIELFDTKQYMSKEDMYYRLVFTGLFPTYNLILPTWMPKWSGDLNDPSGRCIAAFDEQ
jgi:asparagine synthase (glutamine-hydrolysing)